MTYCAIITFKDGKAAEVHQFKNSWGGAAFVWQALWNKYVMPELMREDVGNHYKNWICAKEDDINRLWNLWKREDIRMPLYERIALLGTFDNAILRKENFADFADQLRRFVEAHHTNPQAVCHLGKWADFIETSSAEAVGFHTTSVCENPWMEEDLDGEPVPYKLNTGEKHFEVYEDLKES